MSCSDFLARFSEFHDGEVGPDDREAFEAHLDACAACRRYREVVERGIALLRTLPAPSPREDLRQRLQHAIYHVDESRMRRRSSSTLTGTGAMGLVAAVAILAGILWTPVLFEDVPSVELPPLVVNAPVSAPRPAPAVPSLRSDPSAPFQDSDLWAQPNTLLFEHSPLQRQREGAMVRTGLE